jgi:hypothetical protein
MKKRVLITLGVVLALAATASLLMVLPAGAASWADKVTGGGQGRAGGVHFSITVSAWDDGYGNAAGQMEYSREGQSVPDLSMHVTVACLYVDGDMAAAAGPARAQNDPGGWVDPTKWVVVNIKEGGIGAGDTVRVYKAPPGQACGPPQDGFPGYIYDGNFNIRTK